MYNPNILELLHSVKATKTKLSKSLRAQRLGKAKFLVKYGKFKICSISYLTKYICFLIIFFSDTSWNSTYAVFIFNQKKLSVPGGVTFTHMDYASFATLITYGTSPFLFTFISIISLKIRNSCYSVTLICAKQLCNVYLLYRFLNDGCNLIQPF